MVERDSDASSAIEKALWEELEAYSLDAPSAIDILRVCLRLAGMLISKNKAYGDSALNPLRVFSKADTIEQIKVRMDDKLSRLMRGQAAGEDAVMDLFGYYVLWKVAEMRTAPPGCEPTCHYCGTSHYTPFLNDTVENEKRFCPKPVLCDTCGKDMAEHPLDDNGAPLCPCEFIQGICVKCDNPHRKEGA